MTKPVVFFVTRLRGFFKQLILSNKLDFVIQASDDRVYETNSKLYTLKAKLIKSKFADWLGIIQRINAKSNDDVTIVGSYNRFITSSKPYFIYIENPTALYHYTLGRSKSYLGKYRIGKYLAEIHLKALVFMSKACESTFDELVGVPKKHTIKTQIYPLIRPNPYVTQNSRNVHEETKHVKFIYIAQGIRFKSKGGLEVIEAFKHLFCKHTNITLTIVTNKDMVEDKVIEKINSCEGIELRDFKLTLSEMQKLYADSDVLLQPTSDDSFGLTILEALHSGLAIIASSLYSIPELVKDGVNGFLVEPHYWFFSKGTNLPNPSIWNHRDSTIRSGNISYRLVNDLIERMEQLISNPTLLSKMQKESWKTAHLPPFSEDYIANQWNQLIREIVQKGASKSE